jgi:hypothetical protein
MKDVSNLFQELQAFEIHAKRRSLVPKIYQTGADVAKAIARSKKTSVRRLWSKDDMRLLKSMARKEPAAKIAKALSEQRVRHVKRRRAKESRSA